MSVTRIKTSFTLTQARKQLPCYSTTGPKVVYWVKYGCVDVYAEGLVVFLFWGGLVSGDQAICKTVRAGLADRMPLTQLISAFLSVCLFIHQGVFDLLPQRQSLPLHNFLLYCIAAEQDNNVMGLHVLPSYAHIHTCLWAYLSGGSEMSCGARITRREGNTF